MYNRHRIWITCENLRYYQDNSLEGGQSWIECAERQEKRIREMRTEMVREAERLATLAARARDWGGNDENEADRLLEMVDLIDEYIVPPPYDPAEPGPQEYIAIRKQGSNYWAQRRAMVPGNSAPTDQDEILSKPRKFTRINHHRHMVNILIKKGYRLPIWRQLNATRWTQEA